MTTTWRREFTFPVQQISLGDARSYYVTTARNDLGVIFATSEAGECPCRGSRWADPVLRRARRRDDGARVLARDALPKDWPAREAQVCETRGSVADYPATLRSRCVACAGPIVPLYVPRAGSLSPVPVVSWGARCCPSVPSLSLSGLLLPRTLAPRFSVPRRGVLGVHKLLCLPRVEHGVGARLFCGHQSTAIRGISAWQRAGN